MDKQIYFGVGIDLGTTNSVAATALMQNGKLTAPVLKIERDTDLMRRGFKSKRDELLPSFVAYLDQGGRYEPSVGDFAKGLACTQPYAVACSIKSQMGQKAVDIRGWKPEYPDQTPEAVSARILQKIHAALMDQIDPNIDDAVITIPASFNIAQSEATLRAAELAGFRVRNKDGSFREDVLLSEPEAVIYDVLNQLQNGEIHIALDFTEPKNVMVFDIGGGTLDITLHTIRRNQEHPEVFDIRPVATNRYSAVAGDTFDRTLAERMFEKYLKAYELDSAEAAQRIRREEKMVKIYLLRYAEELKVDISQQYQRKKSMGRALSPSEEFEYGGDMPISYNCADYMEVSEFEETLRPLLGEQFSYDDYKHMTGKEDTRNIIFPVLNVLDKAAKKLGVPDVSVDAVILNGGMSRLYLIENRLEQFFGFRMIKVSDPDKSVAQGAAVYHYYLCQGNSALYQQHQVFLEEQRALEPSNRTFRDVTGTGTSAPASPEPPAPIVPRIRSVGAIQNETLYIGLKGGSMQELIHSGQDLPYQSPRMTGFYVSPGQDVMYIPIKQEGEDRTIASGSIRFGTKYKQEMPVSIQFLLRRDGILTLNAWIEDRHIGDTTIVFGDAAAETKASLAGKKKLLPPQGTKLKVANEVSSFQQAVQTLRKVSEHQRPAIRARISTQKKSLLNCGNPEEFAEPMLELLYQDSSPLMMINLLPVMRRFCGYWTEGQRQRFSQQCLSLLQSELAGLPAQGIGVSANIEAVQSVGACGIREDCQQLTRLCGNQKYQSALLRAFGMSGIEPDWIRRIFLIQRSRGSTQDSLQAIGLLMNYGRDIMTGDDLSRFARDMISYIHTGRCSRAELSLAVVSLGLICRPDAAKDVDEVTREDAVKALARLEETYPNGDWRKALGIARQLLRGEQLEGEQEKYLLGLLDADTL